MARCLQKLIQMCVDESSDNARNADATGLSGGRFKARFLLFGEANRQPIIGRRFRWREHVFKGGDDTRHKGHDQEATTPDRLQHSRSRQRDSIQDLGASELSGADKAQRRNRF